MRKKDKKLIGYAVFWVVFLPIWVLKRIIENGSDVRRQSKILKSEIEHIDAMTGVNFEEYLAAFFKKRGYKVDLTATSGDFGADLILKSNGCRIAVQAKRYSNLVGLDAVREVLGARDYYRADKLMVITNNYFTNAAKKQAESSNVILWDRGSLIQEITKEPEKEMSVYEFVKNFTAHTLTDYKLVAGLLVVGLVYVPAIDSLSSVSQYQWPVQKTQMSSSYPQTTNIANQNNQIVDSEPKTTLQEVTRDLQYSSKRPGYLKYKNGRFGYSIEFPEEFSPDTPPEYGSGFNFISSNGGKLLIYGANNTGYAIGDIYQSVIDRVNGVLGFHVLGKTYFVATWTENGTLYYRKTFLGNGNENTFILTMPDSQKPYFDVVIEVIEDSFRHGNINSAH